MHKNAQKCKCAPKDKILHSSVKPKLIWMKLGTVIDTYGAHLCTEFKGNRIVRCRDMQNRNLRLIRAVGDCRGVQGVQKAISDNADTAGAPRRMKSAKNSPQKRPDKQGWPRTDPIRTEALENNSV